MSKIARVKFIRDKEPNIKALTAKNKVLDGALYVATDTGTLWMGISSSSLIQIKDNINTNTTYNLTKSGNTITLRGSDGSTFNVTDSNTVYGNATTSAAGLMSAADKAKLDGIFAGSNYGTVDAELSTTSTNPVQNKVIKSALDGKSNTGHTHDDRYYTETEINTKLNGKSNTGHKHVKADITDFPTSMPASDVYAWAKAASKPSYTIGEVSGNLSASRISGTIAAANLPSYVDDVLEYASLSKFPTTGESGKIYTALDTNKIYRWSGSAYVVISETVALGTTHSSAGYGDESRAAYNHSTKTSGNPHHVTKTDVGLGNVDNTADSAKSVKYATSAGSAGSVAWSNVSGRPSSMPASDVYSWAKQPHKPSYTASEVGAAAASHSHNYAGADSAGGAANAVKSYGAATANALRPIWFSHRIDDTHRVHNDNFKYNPEGNVVTCNISGTAKFANYLNGTARYVTQTSTAKPYWRCLKLESKESWIDSSVVLCVDSGYENGGFGILAVRFRNDNVSENPAATHGNVQWLCRYGYEPDQFILKIHSAKSTVGYADLYFHATGTYNACNIRILANSIRGGNGSSWQLMNDDPRAAMDTREYTAQAIGYDVGKVAYASSAGSADSVSWGNVSDKPLTFSPSGHTHKMTDVSDWDSYIYSAQTDRTANTILAAPSGSNGKASFRKLVAADLPSHSHDDRYYTESEINTKLNAKAASDVVTISSTKPTSNTCKLWIKP